LNLPIKGNYRMYDISGRIVTANKIAKGIYFVEVDGSIIHKIVKVQ
jgi:hypothetical protein